MHARALGDAAAKVERAAASARLAELARTVATELGRLEDAPSEESTAAAVERRLESAARAAERLAAA